MCTKSPLCFTVCLGRFQQNREASDEIRYSSSSSTVSLLPETVQSLSLMYFLKRLFFLQQIAFYHKGINHVISKCIQNAKKTIFFQKIKHQSGNRSDVNQLTHPSHFSQSYKIIRTSSTVLTYALPFHPLPFVAYEQAMFYQPFHIKTLYEDTYLRNTCL